MACRDLPGLTSRWPVFSSPRRLPPGPAPSRWPPCCPSASPTDLPCSGSNALTESSVWKGLPLRTSTWLSPSLPSFLCSPCQPRLSWCMIKNGSLVLLSRPFPSALAVPLASTNIFNVFSPYPLFLPHDPPIIFHWGKHGPFIFL